jgi:hypothetical protein
MVDQAAARKELLELYDGIEKTAHFQDYVKISAALGSGPNSKEMIVGLRALEAAMVERIVENYKAEESARNQLATVAMKHWNARRATYWRENQPKPEKDENLSHVLTETLEEHERKDGFKQWSEKVPIYVGILKPHAFIQALKERRHWKDVGAGKSHGEFTHRIQWYLLSSGGVIQQQNDHPATVFSTLGDYRHGKWYLWDDLCDRLAVYEENPNKNDWRVPEYLNDWLVSPASMTLCPVLSTFLRFRYKKRELAPAYILKKLGLKELPKTEAIILDFENNKYKNRM